MDADPPRVTISEEEKAANRAAHAQAEVRVKTKQPPAVWILGAIIAGAGGYTLWSMIDAGEFRRAAPPAENKTLAGQDAYLIREYCLSSLRNKLKAPTSAKFYDSVTPEFGNGEWTWNSYVDAQNGLGAQIRSSFSCRVFGSTMDDARVVTVLNE